MAPLYQRFSSRMGAAPPKCDRRLARIGHDAVQILRSPGVDRQREVVASGRGLEAGSLVRRLLQPFHEVLGRVPRVAHLLAYQPKRRHRAAGRLEPEAVRHHQAVGRGQQSVEHADARPGRVIVEADHRAVARAAGLVQVERQRAKDHRLGVDRRRQQPVRVRDDLLDAGADQVKRLADLGDRHHHAGLDLDLPRCPSRRGL